jgi:uncharacterized membrane protein YoaK (UPF0700 family)
MAELQNMRGVTAALLASTLVTGIVDAVSFLALGRVFTANMTGNIVLLGFATGGAPGLSIPRSLLALLCFSVGAAAGGRMTSRKSTPDSARWASHACGVEAFLLLAAAALCLGLADPGAGSPGKVHGAIALTAVAMGLRNAVVRKLGVPDLTTTVLTLTITGLAADSVPAGGDNPRWQRRIAAILAMLVGAAAGALLLKYSAAGALCAGGVITAGCAFTWFRIESKWRQA